MNPVSTSNSWEVWLGEELEAWEKHGLMRALRPVRAGSAVHVEAEGHKLVLFSSNDYLGLSFHPSVREAVARTAQEMGMGPRGSPLVCGYTDLHEKLEHRLAELKGTEAALLFPTGYAANTATLQALADDRTAIFSDALNHASIVDGCRLAKCSGAQIQIYRHADAHHLEDLLKKTEAPKRLIVTDTVFSMDGDLAPLAEIVALREQYGALSIVDEAHATLVFGERGGGLAEEMGVSAQVDIQTGTFSKAFGVQGGFIATNARLRSWLVNRGRAFVFSTALPLPVIAGALAALDVVQTEPRIRKRLWESIGRFSSAIGRPLESPIIPIVIGDNDRTMTASKELFRLGFHVAGIRPPTVPEGTSRLRMALSAAHTQEDIDGLVAALGDLELIPRVPC